MPIQVLWENEEQSVVRWHFTDPWTWQDFNAAQSRCHALMDTVPNTIDIILDLRETEHLPPGAFFRSKRHLDMLHPRAGIVVIVGANIVAQHIYKTLGQMYPILKAKYLMGFADTIEGAHATLASIQATRHLQV